MPPRKSTASAVSATSASPSGGGDVSILPTTTAVSKDPRSLTAQKGNKPSTGASGDAEGERSEKKKSKSDDLGIDDLLLPRTLTSRLSRGTLPPNTSIQRDALLALTKSATVFISYLAHNANNLTSRKTIQSQDILEALRETELWNVQIPGPADKTSSGGSLTLGERVRAEVEKWEGEVRGKRKGYRERVKARESGVSALSAGAGGDEGSGDVNEEQEEEERGPTTKKVRRSSVGDTTVEGETTMDVDVEAEDDEDDEGGEDNDPASTQLKGETQDANGDGTDTDPDVAEEEDEDEDDDNEEEDDDDENEESDRDDADDDEDNEDEKEDSRTRGANINDDARNRNALAPNGRVEVGSDEESD